MVVPGLVQRALRNDFVRHSALVFGATMFGNVLNYLFNFAISRYIGVEAYAELTSLIGTMMILSIPALIVNLIVVKYTAEFHAVEDRARVWLLARRLLLLIGSSAAVLFAIGMGVRPVIAAYLRIPNDVAIVLMIAIICIGFLTSSLRAVLQGAQDFFRLSVSMGLDAFLRATLGIGLVYGALAGVHGAMLGWFGAAIFGLIYTLWAIGKHRALHADPAQLRFDLRRLARTSAGVALATAAMTLLGFMDVLLVKHYFPPHQAGIYAAVNLTGKVVLFLVSFLPAILLPKAVALVQRGQSPVHLLGQAAVGTVLMAGGTLALFGLIPKTIVHIVAGGEFVAAAPYVFQYDLAMGLMAVLMLIVNYRIALHRFGFLYPLGIVLAAEISAIALYHESLWNVVHVVLAGNAVMCIASSVGIARPVAAPQIAAEAA